MKHNRTSLPLCMIFFVGLLLPAASVYAARVVTGSLGTWIAQSASPKLVELLNHHPRFRHEPIKIMAMSDGLPIALSDGLTERIREQLTQDLLSNADVKIVIDDMKRCHPVKVATVLGIEVQKHSAGTYRVSLAMVDIEEGIWLNGTNMSWNGRLSSSQRRALGTRRNDSKATSMPAFHQTSEIAEALYDQLQCIDEIIPPVYFEPVSDDSGQAVLRELRNKISNTMSTTIDKDTATSIISLRLPEILPGNNGIQRRRRPTTPYILVLATADDPAQVHRIAEVNVTSQYGSWQTTTGQNQDDPSSLDLLSEIHIVDRRPRNRLCKSRTRECVEVSFNLNQPAYTVLFYSTGGKSAPLDCKAPTQRKTGRQDYSIKVPLGHFPTRPSVGFYVLAFKDRRAARQVHKAISQGAAKCGGSGGGWLASSSRLLDQFRHRFNWQAIHLTRQDKRITVI